MIQFDSYHCPSEHCIAIYSTDILKAVALSKFMIFLFSFQQIPTPGDSCADRKRQNDNIMVIILGHDNIRKLPSNFRNLRHKPPDQYRRNNKKENERKRARKEERPWFHSGDKLWLLSPCLCTTYWSRDTSLGRQCKMANQSIVDGYQVKEKTIKMVQSASRKARCTLLKMYASQS